MIKYWLSTVLICLIGFNVTYAATQLGQLAFPKLSIPSFIATSTIDGTLEVNGTPMQLQAFVSELDTEELVKRLRLHFKFPMIVQRNGTQQIMGAPYGEGSLQGHYYLTIQIETLPHSLQESLRSKGIISLSYIKAAADQLPQTQQERASWLQQLPQGTQISSLVKSEEAHAFSQHIVAYNALGIKLNQSHLQKILQRKGLELESPSSQQGQQRVLYFKGKQKEGRVTLSRDAQGQTWLVMNLLTSKESLKSWQNP
jgi:hypothetical protein